MFVVQIYIATLLGVSGVAKINYPLSFIRVLRLYTPLNVQTLSFFGKSFSCAEIAIAILIVSGLFPKTISLVVLGLFVLFIFFKIRIFLSPSNNGCGCNGFRYERPVDSADLTVSCIYVILSAFNVWCVTKFTINNSWRVAVVLVFCTLIAYLLTKVYTKRQNKQLEEYSGT
jgi:uncharacterized membrane protein YphA (DoxX/SURF4 family)